MNKNLECVVFGDRDVIKNDNQLPEFKRLIGFLVDKNIKPVILSNDLTDERQLLEAQLKQDYPQLAWYITARDNVPQKPKEEAVKSILDKLGIEPKKAIYIGNSDIDMRTAVNSKLLFLNATWYGENTDYGFKFLTLKEIARFIDIFCLRDNLWAYCINDGRLEYYALGIYGIREKQYDYSLDAKEAAKFGRGHPEFWIKYLLSTVYLSGLHERIDYIAPYPGHQQGSIPSVMEKTIVTFAKCCRKKYLKDLIVRHTTSTKSAFARYNNQPINHFNQLNTIHLNPTPAQNIEGKVYKKSPLNSKKTVLVIDDFCTQGYSLEAARNFIEQTGAKVILISLLKTIIKNYERIDDLGKFDPCNPYHFSDVGKTRIYPFNSYLIEKFAHQEIRSKLHEYDSWGW
jgi:HAD superfamily hydrolase (TIGR01549 family)